jgi:hypothetical protein
MCDAGEKTKGSAPETIAAAAAERSSAIRSFWTKL